MFDFIADLDAYFCEKYANYDKICVLQGYRMPKMHASEVRADGRTYAYTLPMDTMRLALQEEKASLLAQVKEKAFDKTFSFSFRPLSFFGKLRNKFSKKTSFLNAFKFVAAKYNVTIEALGNEVNVDAEIWKNICKGNFVPTKNLLFTLALVAHFSMDDLKILLSYAYYELDFASIKDVVVSYLIEQKVYNPTMVEAALKEYKVENLFFKSEMA
jgi:hypothetical protein